VEVLMTDPVFERISGIISGETVVLFMKGVPTAPQCGFSASVVQVLNKLGVPFAGVNVLADAQIREGIKAFSNWPTIPQLYIGGEFIGGADIVREMSQTGELVAALQGKGVAVAAV